MFRSKGKKKLDINVARDLDLRSACADEQVILPAVDNLHLLSEQQTMLWNLFYPNGIDPHPLQKSDIDPTKMVVALPNVWMHDLVFDDEGNLSEMNIRLHGTRLDEIYGSAWDDFYILTDYAEELAGGEEDEDVRTLNIALELARTEIPLIALVKQLSGSSSHLSEQTLVFPVCRNSDRVNLIFAQTEVGPAVLD